MAGLGFTLLESVFLGGKVTSVIGMASSTMISAITTTTSGIISGIKYLTQYKDHSKELVDELKRIDLEVTVTVIGLLVIELEKEHEKKEFPDSLLKSLESLNDVLNNIHLILKEITEAIEEHNKKYFSKWRTFDAEPFIKRIKDDNVILRIRYKMLLDLLKIKS